MEVVQLTKSQNKCSLRAEYYNCQLCLYARAPVKFEFVFIDRTFNFNTVRHKPKTIFIKINF